MTKFLITALVAGVLAGLAFAGTDLFNPRTSAAEANRMNIEASHQQAVYELQERLSTAKTEAEIREIQRQQGLLEAQYQHDLQALAQDLAHREIAFKTWMTILTYVGSALSITVVLSTSMWVGSKALVNIRSIPPQEKPMTRFVPPVEKRIPSLAEREPYDALDPKQILFASRLDERLQEIATEREHRDDAQLLVARMRAISDPAKMSSEQYRKSPLVR